MAAVDGPWMESKQLLARRLDEQQAVLSWRRAVALHGYERVRWQLDRGRWQAWSRRVVVHHSGPVSAGQLRWCALEHAGPASVLAGRTAAALGGLAGFERPVVQVAVPSGARVVPMDGLRIVRTRHLDQVDLHPVGLPPRMRLPRALVDMAGAAAGADGARAVLAAGVQQRLVTVRQLREVLARLPVVCHSVAMRVALDDIEGGSHSLPELQFIRLVRGSRLPLPDRQAVRQRPDGRHYLDADWDAYRLVAEIDGAAHQDDESWWADSDRQNAIVCGGDRILRFPSHAVRYHGPLVVQRLTEGLRLGGWPG